MNKKIVLKSLFYLLVACLCVLWLLPMVFVVLSAVKTNADFYDHPLLTLPASVHWPNFVKAAERGKVFLYMKNSLSVVVLAIPLGILLQSMAGFALARLHIRHATGLFSFFLFGMMIPMQCLLIPVNIGMTRLGLVNTHVGLALIYIGIQTPFGIMVMRGAFRGMPVELDEAGRLDGCNNLQLFLRVLLPCAKPAMSTLVILQFLACWNELLFSSLIVTRSRLSTIPVGILTFFGEQGTEYPLLCAAVLLIVLPVLLIYLIFQRYFVEGMSGAVKG